MEKGNQIKKSLEKWQKHKKSIDEFLPKKKSIRQLKKMELSVLENVSNVLIYLLLKKKKLSFTNYDNFY